MLRRYFIPLILGLAILATVIYFYGGRTIKSRDVRTLVPVERFHLSNGRKYHSGTMCLGVTSGSAGM